MREFPLIDILPLLKERNVGRTTQLFIISIIAHYHEKLRAKGKYMDEFKLDDKNRVIYKVTIREKEIKNKFKFGIDTLIKIKKELINKKIMKIKYIRSVSRKKNYNFNPDYCWLNKHQNYEEEYLLPIKRSGRAELYVPTGIIYDKKLTYSEKLAIVWNFSLKARLGHQPTFRELEKESGISKKTIGKACDKYPNLFGNT